MEQDTFRNRLTRLTQKTRKALRLYSSSVTTASKTPLAKNTPAHNLYRSNSFSRNARISGNAGGESRGTLKSNSDNFSAELTRFDAIDYSSLQVQQWREVTKDLLEKITPLLTVSSNRKLVIEFYGVRDQFYNEWRLLQADLHTRQLDLEAAAESGEFIKCVNLSVELVALKARMQACQAAHNELQRIIDNSKVSSPSRREIELSKQTLVEGEEIEENFPKYDPDDSNVIPLRRRNF